MELMLQTNPLCYLKTAVREVRCQEETGETLVPDGEPDIATLADCAAEVYLRGKDLAGGDRDRGRRRQGDGALPARRRDHGPVPGMLSALYDQGGASGPHRPVGRVLRNCGSGRWTARILNARKALLPGEFACAVTAYQAGGGDLRVYGKRHPRGGDPRDRDP